MLLFFIEKPRKIALNKGSSQECNRTNLYYSIYAFGKFISSFSTLISFTLIYNVKQGKAVSWLRSIFEKWHLSIQLLFAFNNCWGSSRSSTLETVFVAGKPLWSPHLSLYWCRKLIPSHVPICCRAVCLQCEVAVSLLQFFAFTDFEFRTSNGFHSVF